MGKRVHVEDTGTGFTLRIGTDITDAILAEIDIKKADGAFETWNASIYDTTKIMHITEKSDFSISGRYKAQAQVTTPDGIWSGKEVEFIVYPKLIIDP